MPPIIRSDALLLRLLKDVNDIRSVLRRTVANLPLYDISNENTPTQLTADQNDYVPGNYDVLKLSGNDARTITGFRGGVKGRFLRLFNVGVFEITIAHQSASSALGNRIKSATGFDIIINAGGELVLYYDADQAVWISSYSSNADRISVELRLSGAQSIPNATYTQISWTSVIVDSGEFFDALNPEYITIPETGWYQVMAHVAWDINGTNMRESMTEKSITTLYGNISFDSRLAVTGASTNVEMARLTRLNRGDRIYLTVWQDSGGPLNVNVDGPRDSFTTLIVTKM